VTLLSSDGQRFEVEIEVAKMSQTIRDIVEGLYCRNKGEMGGMKVTIYVSHIITTIWLIIF